MAYAYAMNKKLNSLNGRKQYPQQLVRIGKTMRPMMNPELAKTKMIVNTAAALPVAGLAYDVYKSHRKANKTRRKKQRKAGNR